ncbi:hypothetical protein [Actinoplanes solisilvae]|uniref:hypothetical protein n=1 Tax=Actinoplanes solisilvae TaxID=2486853 RepID=UPI000FD74CAA|nr:hypothetical protein [Actinoplanes solisilvae]
MVIPLLIVTVLSVACMLAGWFLPDLVAGGRRRRRGAPDARPAAATRVKPESLEGVLVAQLIAGEITPVQYRRSLEGLAARDDDRNPLCVPPDLGPADA